MLGGRFILLFFACLLFLSFRSTLTAITVYSCLQKIAGSDDLLLSKNPVSGEYELAGEYEFTDISLLFSLMAVQLMPQFFLSLSSTIGFSKDSFKLVFQHPSLLLMSSGTQKDY